MLDRMAAIVPSRGRPQNIERLCKKLLELNSQVDLYVGVDPDDPALDEYKTLEELYGFILVVADRRERFGPTLNRIALDLASEYRYLYWQGDDHVPQTLGWDERYRQKLDELGVGIVYGNDLVMGSSIATQLAMTSNIVRALGYAVPEGFIHLYIDNYFMELAKAIGKLVYLPDVIVQHMHPCAGQAEEDQTYREANSPENWSNDRRRFEQYMQEELQLDVEKLKAVIND
jgi:hypothetical protein